jgi:hypothetical protein
VCISNQRAFNKYIYDSLCCSQAPGSVRNSVLLNTSTQSSSNRDSSNGGVVTTDVAQYQQQQQQIRNRLNKSTLPEDDDIVSNSSFSIRRSSASHASSFISTTPSSVGNTFSGTKVVQSDVQQPLINRDSNVSGGDNIDAITTQLLLNGGGWLVKKGHRFGGDAWKKRWVTIYKGCMYYDKARLPRLSDGNSVPQAKQVSLSNVTLGMGSDGRTIRLTSFSQESEQPLITDWRCETQEERDAWILYIKSGINQTTKV